MRMCKYEAMFVIKPDLSESERKNKFQHISDVIAKNNGTVLQSNIWAEKRRLAFPIKKIHEATYYLVNFSAPPEAVDSIKQAYRIDEDILRTLIIKTEGR
ncbi:MAG: 30S ribosomal protein S6 [Candidatus Omnitrophica bacterium]|nr:30S ribosomal protein S6 [Candidatus Omnitrophota bacterium]